MCYRVIITHTCAEWVNHSCAIMGFNICLSVVNAVRQNSKTITIMFRGYETDIWNNSTTPYSTSVDSIATVFKGCIRMWSFHWLHFDCQGPWPCWFTFWQGKVHLCYCEIQVMVWGIRVSSDSTQDVGIRLHVHFEFMYRHN